MVNCLLSWIELHPGTAAWVQAVGAIGALAIAIWIPWWQQRKTRAAEQRSLRHALHTEVAMIAHQCVHELNHWRAYPPMPREINPRTALLPPLVIFLGNAGKVGLLLRDEILHLIGFSGTLQDLAIKVNEMIERNLQGQEARERVQVLLSNACGNAATFLEVVPDAQDRKFIATLREAYQSMDEARRREADSPRRE